MPRELLRINLLPESARKTTLSPVEQFHRTPLMALAVGVMALIPLSLFIPTYFHRQKLQRLTAKIQTLEPRRIEMDQLQRTLQRLRTQEAAFQGLKKGQGLWSRRLNTLSSVTPNGVWFTELSLDPAKGLVIQGSAIASAGPAMVTVSRIAQDLKADADFASAFKQIQIESIKQVQEGEFDIVQFTVTCTVQGPST